MDKFLIGCCYYPEHWDSSYLERDLERIKDLGFNCIRMGEFAWSLYEKEEGKYDFSFLIRAVEYAQKLGLYVILGTPTAAPPKWLMDKYPEILCVDENGIVMQHGARQHHNHTSEIYLRYCERIAEEMVKRFAKYECVIGWQIDNEINCHRNESYAESDDIAFRKWLQNKYGTIDKLNKAWGNAFWSLDFNDFSQVTCPRKHPAYPNPSWKIDYYLFWSDSAINYASVQAKIIRKYMPEAFITHNGWFKNIDYHKLTNECLDFLSFDNYPSFQERNGKALSRKAFYKQALTRGCSDKFMILEQQSGPGGQLSYMLPTPRPGQIRLWTYQSIFHGAVGILYFRYRTALFGAEQLWYGIYDHDGEENYRSREIRQISQELARVGNIFIENRPLREVAIYSDYHNECADKIESFAENDSWHIADALNAKNVQVDFIDGTVDFDKYKVIVFPHITVADELLESKIKEFTSKGGIAIISARSGVKDKNAHYRPITPPGVFRELAGCKVEWFTALRNDESQFVEMDGKEYRVDSYYELLNEEKGKTLGVYANDFGKGKSAIVKNGNVYYLGFYAKDSAKIYYDIIAKHITCEETVDANLEKFTLGDYEGYLNYGDYEIELSGYDIITQREIKSIAPYGVALIKK